jgi:cephalosporin hydroxylase
MPRLPTLVRRPARAIRRRLPAVGVSRLKVGRFTAPKGLRPLDADELAATEAFHRVYYDSWATSRADGVEKKGRGTIALSWFGYRTLKSPLDLWTYQEILVETRPNLVVECGTRHGGSAYYIASILDLLGDGRVVTIDIEAVKGRPVHPRISYLLGSSTDPGILAQVRRLAAGKRTMVILDSDHSQAHVSAELAVYRDIVSVGSYLIVEDTNVNGHPVLPKHGPGPMEALDSFLATTDDFVVDADRERFMMTLNPRGFLRRVR